MLGILAPARWDREAIRMRLEQTEKIHNEKVVDEILTATSGWHYLLDRLLQSCARLDDPRTEARKLAAELRQTGSAAHGEFRNALGFPLEDIPWRILNYLIGAASGPIPVDLVELEAIGIDRQTLRAGLDYLTSRQIVALLDEEIVVDGVVRSLVAEAA